MSLKTVQNSIPKHILPVIVIAQFAGTSLWFAGNAVLADLITSLSLPSDSLGFITMAVQAGFITGTLGFAILSIADRFSPVKVFLCCAILGSVTNMITIFGDGFIDILASRFLTGFFLAGIYPVGMKIASDWHKEGLGKALGYLVGALVLGTAFPHLLKFLGGDLPWKFVLIGTSTLSSLGGLLLFLTVSDGPFRVRRGEFQLSMFLKTFKDKNFRSAAFGYFGHMWELYTFWAFVPVILGFYFVNNPASLSVSMLSFLVIGIGALSCAIGGHLSFSTGSKTVAQYSIFLSGICCLLLPFLFESSIWIFLGTLFIWGISVIPDSPQFSTLVAQSSDKSYIATGLTIVNCIGFTITIVSIQLVNFLWISFQNPIVFLVMLAGPLFGFLSIRKFSL